MDSDEPRQAPLSSGTDDASPEGTNEDLLGTPLGLLAAAPDSDAAAESAKPYRVEPAVAPPAEGRESDGHHPGERRGIEPSVAEDEDLERFDLPGTTRLGIVGGKGVGKSYLFQAMVYRTLSGISSGALTYFLERDSIRLFEASERSGRARPVNVAEFLHSYSRWERLLQTHYQDLTWYRLQLRYRTGLLGCGRSALNVEYLDGSGEAIFGAQWGPQNRALWREGFRDARMMVFCLPLWVLFPCADLPEEDWSRRDKHLHDFQEVVHNFETARRRGGDPPPVSTILALTMADDPRCALSALRERWILPFMDSPHTYLKQLRRGRGVARYLANARRVSATLHEELLAVRDPLVSALPGQLDFGGGRPWLIPVSAIEGSLLDALERQGNGESPHDRRAAPVPVHVELPLLVALCQSTNSLM